MEIKKKEKEKRKKITLMVIKRTDSDYFSTSTIKWSIKKGEIYIQYELLYNALSRG